MHVFIPPMNYSYDGISFQPTKLPAVLYSWIHTLINDTKSLEEQLTSELTTEPNCPFACSVSMCGTKCNSTISRYSRDEVEFICKLRKAVYDLDVRMKSNIGLVNDLQ